MVEPMTHRYSPPGPSPIERAVKGLTAEQAEAAKAMFLKSNLCRCCNRPMKPFYVDIDENGLVRGLLCHSCNRFIDDLKDRDLLDLAVRYLSGSPSPVTTEHG